MTGVGPWHGKTCTGGDTTIRDSWTCCSRAVTQKLIPNIPKPAREKSNKFLKACEEALPVLGGFLQPLFYPGQSLGSPEKHLQVLWCFSCCHFSPGLCHSPSKQCIPAGDRPRDSWEQRVSCPYHNGSCTLPTALGKEMGHVEHAGAWDGAWGQWPQPGPALCTPIPQAVGMMQGGKSTKKPKTTEIPVKAWT